MPMDFPVSLILLTSQGVLAGYEVCKYQEMTSVLTGETRSGKWNYFFFSFPFNSEKV